MSEKLWYVILFAIVILIFLLLKWYIDWKNYRKAESRRKKMQDRRAMQGLLVTCPLCRSPLLPGENLYSRVYRPMTVSDQLCTISGCPHCYPTVQAGLSRECPVCHKKVPVKDGHLTARLFNKTDGKKHVIVTGCTECSKHSVP